MSAKDRRKALYNQLYVDEKILGVLGYVIALQSGQQATYADNMYVCLPNLIAKDVEVCYIHRSR